MLIFAFANLIINLKNADYKRQKKNIRRPRREFWSGGRKVQKTCPQHQPCAWSSISCGRSFGNCCRQLFACGDVDYNCCGNGDVLVFRKEKR